MAQLVRWLPRQPLSRMLIQLEPQRRLLATGFARG